jgi:hypothetical protein
MLTKETQVKKGDFRISAEATQKAEMLTDALRGWIERSRPRRESYKAADETIHKITQELGGTASMEDVLADALDFAWTYAFAMEEGAKIPMARLSDDSLVPILVPPGRWGNSYWRLTDWQNHVHRMTARMWSNKRNDVHFSTPKRALSRFSDALQRFLGFRLEGSNGDDGGGGTTGSSRGALPPPGTAAPGKTGFYVKLACKGYRLRAHASPAYAISWSQFADGRPTTPVTGILAPGIWIFGADGGSLRSIVPDPSPVNIPPNFSACAIAF